MSFPKLSFINSDDDCDNYATNNDVINSDSGANSYKAWWAYARWLAGAWSNGCPIHSSPLASSSLYPLTPIL